MFTYAEFDNAEKDGVDIGAALTTCVTEDALLSAEIQAVRLQYPKDEQKQQ